MKPVKEKTKEKNSREKEPEENKKEGKERKENTVEGHHRFEASNSQPFILPLRGVVTRVVSPVVTSRAMLLPSTSKLHSQAPTTGDIAAMGPACSLHPKPHLLAYTTTASAHRTLHRLIMDHLRNQFETVKTVSSP